MPSISANGRYVSFTTNEQLVPADENRGPDVYRRDMEPGPGESQYTLVSAVNDSEAGATYAYTGEGGSLEQRETEFGSLAGARSAMSADGEQVAFITTAQSDLLGGAEPTPAGEVLVRDIGNHETKLVSAEYQPGAGWTSERPVQPTTDEAGFTQYGAVFPGAGQTPRFGVYQGATDGQGTWLGASISANGSTVAWMGQDLGRQAQLLPDEQPDEPPQTAEPLWRRIEPAPGAPIRRITGGSDPTSAACVASAEQEIPENSSRRSTRVRVRLNTISKTPKGCGAVKPGSPTSSRSSAQAAKPSPSSQVRGSWQAAKSSSKTRNRATISMSWTWRVASPGSRRCAV